MSKQPIERRAGAPRRFSFRGVDYNIGDASIAQHYELIEVLKRHVPDPWQEAAQLLRDMGDVLTPEERRDIINDARESRKTTYVTRVRILWDDRDPAPIKTIDGEESDDLTQADCESLGLPATANLGDAVKLAWGKGLRPDDETTRKNVSIAESRLRDALNVHYSRTAKEITEQVGGWPPSMASPAAWMVLYGGPALPEALGVLLPPWNDDLSRADAEALGRAILDDISGEGLKAFHEAMDPTEAPEGDGDEADKSGQAGPPVG